MTFLSVGSLLPSYALYRASFLLLLCVCVCGWWQIRVFVCKWYATANLAWLYALYSIVFAHSLALFSIVDQSTHTQKILKYTPTSIVISDRTENGYGCNNFAYKITFDNRSARWIFSKCFHNNTATQCEMDSICRIVKVNCSMAFG